MSLSDQNTFNYFQNARLSGGRIIKSNVFSKALRILNVL